MNSAIIVAAGKSERFSSGEINKVNLILKNKPVYMYSVDLFLARGYEVILVTNELVEIEGVKVVKGGLARTDSVKNGLLEANGEYVFIHDAARPMLNNYHLDLLEEALKDYDFVYLAKRVSDSLKHFDGKKYSSVNRDDYILAQTPQVFKTELLKEAFKKASKTYTDEVSLIEDVLKIESKPIFSDEYNEKITYEKDFNYMNNMLASYKIGHSFDIHKLVEKRDLYLGGIKIDSKWGLLGHSDADVVLHAITEAILGALGLGDLGSNFPDNDPQYLDIRSDILLKNAIHKMNSLNYGISNIDISMYLEAPKILKYRNDIKNNIAKLLNISDSVINFKATTTEKIGPIGKHEAIACEVVVLLKEELR